MNAVLYHFESAMATLQALPVELIEAIAVRLDGTQDLCSFRQLSRTVQHATREHFRKACFTERSILLTRRSLKRLGNLLEHDLGSQLKRLVIRGGLLEWEQLSHERHMYRMNGIDMRDDDDKCLREILNRPCQPDFTAMLTDALCRIRSRRLESLIVDVPEGYRFSNVYLGERIRTKCAPIALEALARSGVQADKLDLGGPIEPSFGISGPHLDDVGKSVRNTRALSLGLHLLGVDADWTLRFLQLFENLDSLELRVGPEETLKRPLLFQELVRQACEIALPKVHFKDLTIWGRYAGYKVMMAFLEREGLERQCQELGVPSVFERRAFWNNSSGASLDYVRLENMDRLSARYTHRDCCTRLLSGDDFELQFSEFHEHVKRTAGLVQEVGHVL